MRQIRPEARVLDLAIGDVRGEAAGGEHHRVPGPQVARSSVRSVALRAHAQAHHAAVVVPYQGVHALLRQQRHLLALQAVEHGPDDDRTGVVVGPVRAGRGVAAEEARRLLELGAELFDHPVEGFDGPLADGPGEGAMIELATGPEHVVEHALRAVLDAGTALERGSGSPEAAGEHGVLFVGDRRGRPRGRGFFTGAGTAGLR